MLNWLKCLVFGHPETQEHDYSHAIKTKCVRCGATLDSRKEYRHRANEFLHRTRRPTIWEPVEEITDADGRILRPGDRVGYMGQSAFPGLKWEKSGRVEFIYEDPEGRRNFALKHRDRILIERDIIGYKPPISEIDRAEPRQPA